MMILPSELTQKFDTEISDYEEEKKMPYVTSLERLYLERGEERGNLSNARQSILQVLEIRFQSVPNSIRASLNSISDLPRLQELLGIYVTISSVDDFINLISSNSTNL